MNNLNFDSGRWKVLCNTLVIGISLFGIANQNLTVGKATIFEQVLLEIMAPIQKGTMSFKDLIEQTFNQYIFIVNTRKENEQLQRDLNTARNQIFSLQEVQKENERLKQLLDFGKDIQRKKVLAQVVSWDSSNEFKVLRINKGENQGLSLLSPVITMTGLVGYVYRLSPNYADILTILDQNNRVDAIVARNRTHGIVEGHLGFKCRFKYVSRTEQLNKDDIIITAGLGEIYPKGIKVGKVSLIDKESYGITQRIEITPSVDFDKLEEVVVLIDQQKHKAMAEEMLPIGAEGAN